MKADGPKTAQRVAILVKADGIKTARRVAIRVEADGIKTGAPQAAGFSVSCTKPVTPGDPLTTQATVARIQSMSPLEDHIEALEEVLAELGESESDASVAQALLSLMEKNADEDDFGLFHGIESYLGQFEEGEADTLVRASVARRPMWKTLELIGGGEEDIATLRTALTLPLDDETKELVHTTLDERLEDS